MLYCLLRNPAANNVYNLGQLPIASYSTKPWGVPHLLKTPGGILKYGYSIYSFHAHRIVTCVKQNNVIIFLYDLVLHNLINKILNVNIME